MDILFAPMAEEGEGQAGSEVTNAADLLAQAHDLSDENENQQNSNDVIADSQLTSSVSQNGSDGNVIAVRESSSNECTTSVNVGFLLLAYMNLTSFPPIPIDCSRLARIDLSYNKLKNIPPIFLQSVFKNVYAFAISFNLIKNIPEEFSSNFPKLTHLNISNNEIQKLPLSLRNCSLSTFNCVDNPFLPALKGIIGGSLSNFNSDCNIAALNLQYFFGIISFYLGLEKSNFEQKEEILTKWSNLGNYKATIFLKLVEAYQSVDQDQVNGNEAEEIDYLLQMKAKWAHQRFCKIVPAEVRKFNLEASMESLESLLHLIDEIQPEETRGTQVVKEYLDVVNEKIEKEIIDGLKPEELESEVVDETTPEVKPPKWTKKERCWFLSIVSVVGFIGCYLLFWPLFAVVLVSTDGMKLFRRNYLSKVIPYWWTSLLADNHSWLQVRIFKFLPLFITKHLPIIDYHFPFWQKFWKWITTYFNWN